MHIYSTLQAQTMKSFTTQAHAEQLFVCLLYGGVPLTGIRDTLPSEAVLGPLTSATEFCISVVFSGLLQYVGRLDLQQLTAQTATGDQNCHVRCEVPTVCGRRGT